MIPALQELADTAAKLFQVRCTLSCSGSDLDSVKPVIVTHLFRIAQEAIQNAIRHGKATQIELQLSRDENLCLKVLDNGSGFRPPPKNWMGVGLQSMRYRAQEIGGSLDLRTLPQGGTVVVCTVPLTSVVLRNQSAVELTPE